jgi:hypothetical protein
MGPKRTKRVSTLDPPASPEPIKPSPAGRSGLADDGDEVRGRAATTATEEWDVVSTMPSVAPTDTTAASDAPADGAAAASAGPDAITEWTEEKVGALRGALKAAPWHATTQGVRVVDDVMTGAEFADFLKQQNFAATAAEATSIGTALLRRQLLFPMRKSLKKHGFRVDADHFYSMASKRKERVSLFGAVRGVQAANAIGSSAANGNAGVPLNGVLPRPVLYESVGGEITEARIQERQRRSGGSAVPDGRWSADKLLQSDPAAWSMARNDVPVPAVGDASPDKCAWGGEWEPVVTVGETDAGGWYYMAAGFQSKETLHPDREANANVRFRNWRRRAHKTVEVAVHGADGGADRHMVISGDELRHREQLERAAMAMRRQTVHGVLKFTLVRGRSIPCNSRTFVTVTCYGQVARSDSSEAHAWNLEGAVRLDARRHALVVRVFKSGGMGSKPEVIGQGEFVVPEGEMRGTRYVPLHGGRADKVVRREAEKQRDRLAASGAFTSPNRSTSRGRSSSVGDFASPLLMNAEPTGPHVSASRRGGGAPSSRMSASGSSAGMLGGNANAAEPACQIVWEFAPADTADSDTRSMMTIGPGKALTDLVTKPLHTGERYVGSYLMHLQVLRAEDLVLSHGKPLSLGQRFLNAVCCSCCGCGPRLDLTSKLFVVVRYRGTYADSKVRSKPVPLSRNPEFAWEAVASIDPTMPVVIEVTRQDSDGGSGVIGRAIIDFDGSVGANHEAVLPLDRNGDASRGRGPTAAGAGGSSPVGRVRGAHDIDATPPAASVLPDVEALPLDFDDLSSAAGTAVSGSRAGTTAKSRASTSAPGTAADGDVAATADGPPMLRDLKAKRKSPEGTRGGSGHEAVLHVKWAYRLDRGHGNAEDMPTVSTSEAATAAVAAAQRAEEIVAAASTTDDRPVTPPPPRKQAAPSSEAGGQPSVAGASSVSGGATATGTKPATST